MNAKAVAGQTRLMAGFVLLCLAVPGGRAQPGGIQHANNFTTTEYYEPPNQRQIRSVLSGVEALPQPGGLLLIKQLRLETYGLDGRLESVVVAPECLYDTIKGVANSPGHLQVRTGEGKYRVEGEGFLWRQSDNFLTISNQVHTVLESGAKTNTIP